MNNFGDKVSFIWGVADLLRDAFRRSKYPDVILPLTVLRRLDCAPQPTEKAVAADQSETIVPMLGVRPIPIAETN